MRFLYDLVALAVLAALIYYALHKYHVRQAMALRQEYAEFGGWQKLRWRTISEVWQCPFCGMPAFSWAAVEGHQDPELSACAEKTARREALEAAAERDDGAPTGPHWSAEMMAGHGGGAGATDTMSEEPEGIEAN